jgi:hypothetical protein
MSSLPLVLLVHLDPLHTAALVSLQLSLDLITVIVAALGIIVGR